MKKLSIAKDVLFLLVAAIFSVSQKVSLMTVTSRSMEPTLKAGDTVITKKVDVSTVNQGDIIVLPVPLNPTLRYVHRVFEFSKESDEFLIKTKGDANPEPDEWTMEITSKE
ncbi:MAG: signal peptidase I, partial [Actinobacteria bacterium]|nr:signal peptidase I [Actinomycetota bacterium]